MNKNWLIAIIVILIIAGSIGSAYMLRSVGSLAIDLEALTADAAVSRESIALLQEQVAALEAKQVESETLQARLESDNVLMMEKMDYISMLLREIPGMVERFGTIENLQAANGYVTFVIDRKEWLSGEAALTFLMDEYGLSLEQAVMQLPNNFYIRDLEEDGTVYRLDKSASIRLLNEDGELVASTLNALVTLVSEYSDLENYPIFTFYVLDDLILEVEQHYVP